MQLPFLSALDCAGNHPFDDLSVEHEIEKWWEDEDAVKENRKLIRQKLKNCLKANGYRQGRCSCFYRFFKDYVVYYKPEHPSIMTYLWLCIYPLYMPPGDLRVCSFGDRLSSLTDNYVWNIRDYESEESIDEWCRRITDTDNTYVASLIKEISTISSADRLLDCKFQSESGEKLSFASIICLGAEKVNCLKMFTKLALHKYDEASKIANSTLQAGVDGSLRVNQNLTVNCKRVIDLAFIRDDNYVDSIINTWREANNKRFIL